MNKVILVGNLGHDPSLKELDGDKKVCEFSVATNESKDKVEWHRVKCWDKTAELCKQYLAKGRKVAIDGRLATRKFEDQDGNNRYITEVIANRVEFLTPKNEVQSEMAQNNNNASSESDEDLPF